VSVGEVKKLVRKCLLQKDLRLTDIEIKLVDYETMLKKKDILIENQVIVLKKNMKQKMRSL